MKAVSPLSMLLLTIMLGIHHYVYSYELGTHGAITQQAHNKSLSNDCC